MKNFILMFFRWVFQSRSSYLYSKLPVLIVDIWSDINLELLINTIKLFNYDVLQLEKEDIFLQNDLKSILS
jgi:hypothetical protein